MGRVAASDRWIIARAMALTDPETFADRLVDRLSGGERQRVWLAMWVAQDAGCFLLDAPISALDVAHQVVVLDLMRRRNERHRSEVFIRQKAVERRDGSEILRRFIRPLLVICGDSDAVTPPMVHRKLSGLNPAARLVIVPKAGHMAPIEQPEAVLHALRMWLLEA